MTDPTPPAPSESIEQRLAAGYMTVGGYGMFADAVADVTTLTAKLAAAEAVIEAAEALVGFAWPTLPLAPPKSRVVALANDLFAALATYRTTHD